MSRELRLFRGQIALVDDQDYDRLSQYRWRLNNTGYVVRTQITGPHHDVLCLHREILQAQRGEVVDHIDHDRLNNTRANLRIITQQQNLMYRRRFKNNQAGYKGVTRQHGKWHARIHIDSRTLHLGFYDDPETAARVYDAAARFLFGEFALVNFPDEITDIDVEVLLLPLLAEVRAG